MGGGRRGGDAEIVVGVVYDASWVMFRYLGYSNVYTHFIINLLFALKLHDLVA